MLNALLYGSVLLWTRSWFIPRFTFKRHWSITIYPVNRASEWMLLITANCPHWSEQTLKKAFLFRLCSATCMYRYLYPNKNCILHAFALYCGISNATHIIQGSFTAMETNSCNLKIAPVSTNQHEHWQTFWNVQFKKIVPLAMINYVWYVLWLI